MKRPSIHPMKLLTAAALIALPFLYTNMVMVPPATFPYANLTTVAANGLCTVRPSAAGAPFYNAIVGNRAITGVGLSNAEVLNHAATRLGFGVSSLGPIVPANANDCTTVFISEEIARQISLLSENADNGYTARVRQGLVPTTMYTRSNLAKAMWRFQNDPTDLTVDVPYTAHGNLWWQSQLEVAMLDNLRSLVGSQTIVNGQVYDHQVNIKDSVAEFWYNHFNVDGPSIVQFHGGVDNLHEKLRPFMGHTFYNLLTVAMHHPAMLQYLSNGDNRAICTGTAAAGTYKCIASNQNLGREALELHTIGMGPAPATVGSPYTQDDVVAMSTILAGYNVWHYTNLSTPSEYVYRPTLAANHPVTVMGVSYANTGETRLNSVLANLARHPKTKANICKKLAEYYFAQAYVASGAAACSGAWGTYGDLKPIMTAMFKLPAFWARPNYRTLYRTPVEIPIATARALGYNVLDLYRKVTQFGMTHTNFNPVASTFTPASYSQARKAKTSTSVHWSFYAIMNEIEQLLGTHRGQVAFPTGYSMKGSDYLSSAYVDAVSRTGFNIGYTMSGIDNATPVNLVSSTKRSQYENQITAIGMRKLQQDFIENQLQFGPIGIFSTPQPIQVPYTLPALHVTIINQVLDNRVYWPYYLSDPTAKQINKILPVMFVSHAQEMKK